ncbi:cobalamin biosynthesis protein CobW [Kribbella sandramycini]|uniref:Cobalamin biosynthesis protein CobW n=1 Tax=Kribbella sandramycini TaxID=60450 RepID=A0A7Y4L1G0_9ACTN|nr:GTP-binding protein [Kribbella sandramycini]MBB6565252.1 G3E family GTPase [Kribbella sandramycini]NOL41521.1 cobalamin biosynthesis protein CobW [Kribbella sandramycini]
MLPVTLLTGVDEDLRGTTGAGLLATAGPTGVLVEYDVRDLPNGEVVRIARTATGVIDREVITMGHPCVSCAMRGTLVQLLRSIAAVDRYAVAIVSVPGAGDTQSLAEEIARDGGDDLRVDAVITAIDTATVVTDLTGEDLIQDRGIATAAEDGRAIAEVVARQIEYADAAVLSSDDATTRALVQAINPQARVQTTPAGLLAVRLHDPDAAETRTEPGSITAPLHQDGPVQTLVWQSARPFHPERLYDVLEELVAGTARGRGTVWIATQHRSRLSWDSFGTNIAIGVLGPWLADLPADRWASVGQQHQARSALEWHPEHGDRGSYLSITGVGLDVRELTGRLDGCVLRADEAVHPLTDPFAPYLEGSTAA